MPKFDVIKGGRLTGDFAGREVRKSIHAQLFDLMRSPREVGIRNGIKDAEAVAIAVEVERELADRRADLAWRAGRRSLLTPPPATAARRAA